MESILKKNSLVCSLILGLFIAICFCGLTILSKVRPYFDGEGYILRAYSLYGYLHSGHWKSFCDVLTAPNQTLLPLHYVCFFLLPKSFAGFVSYVVVQDILCFVSLAYGIFRLSEALNREEWASPIFILCVVNNVALNPAYAFYLDMTFMGLAALIIAVQIKAWLTSNLQFRVELTIAICALLLLKPANAFLFLWICVISDMIYISLTLKHCKKPHLLKSLASATFHRWPTILALFTILSLFIWLGGLQTIFQLIDHNEVNSDPMRINGGFFIRMCYFPLCLFAFYNVSLLLLLFVAAISVDCHWSHSFSAHSQSPFPVVAFFSVLLAYFFLGEMFSFVFVVKSLRSLVVMIPLIWFSIFWLWERSGLKSQSLWFLVAGYTGIILSQVLFNSVGSSAPNLESSYQITRSSLRETPSSWFLKQDYSEALSSRIEEVLPKSGTICTTSIGVRSILVWDLERQDLLLGKTPQYVIKNLLDYKGEYFLNALYNANVIVAITISPDMGIPEQEEAKHIVSYGQSRWIGNRNKYVCLASRSDSKVPACGVFLLEHPLSLSQINEINSSPPFNRMPITADKGGEDFIQGRHYSRDEMWQLLLKWYSQRVGKI